MPVGTAGPRYSVAAVLRQVRTTMKTKKKKKKKMKKKKRIPP